MKRYFYENMAALSIDSIIQRIADLQDETGLFPSFRHNPTVFYRRPDTNVFFTAVTVFTLQKLRSRTARKPQFAIDRIASGR